MSDQIPSEDRVPFAAVVAASLTIPFGDRKPLPSFWRRGVQYHLSTAMETFLPRIQLAVLVAASNMLHAVESTPVMIGCVWVVVELSSLLERWTLVEIAVVP